MHIRDQRNSNNFHGYKKIDLIINSKFIESQQTHRKRVLHQIDQQEHRGELCIENQRESRSHLANNYGPEGPQRTTHATSERHQWWW